MARCLFGILALVGVSYLALAQTPSPPPAAEIKPAPTRVEQRQILAAVTEYAARYVDSLPDFICDQTVRQFEAGRKPKHWRQLDSLTSKLVFNKGREERSLEMVNGKPVSARRHVRTPLTSEGEFGILVREIFNPDTDTTFSWSGWEWINGRQMAVLNFSIDRRHSSLKLTGDMGSGIAPYRGTVTSDPDTGEIWKVTDEAFDIPRIVQTESIATSIEYDHITIAGRTYLLPVRAVVMLNTGENNIRNEMTFEGYRKFESDSTITFTAVDPPSRKGSAEPNL